MYNIDDLPNDIINMRMFDYLPINNIHSMLLTNRKFNSILNSFQLNIIKNASRGWKYCICNGLLNSSKWIYQLRSKSKNPINIHEYGEYAFRISCQKKSFRNK